MTAPDDAVAAIDAALEAWESGPDAYRWEPDAEPGLQERRPLRSWLDPGFWDTALRGRCSVTGDAVIQRHDGPGWQPPELRWLRADPEIHIAQELLDQADEHGMSFLSATYELAERCPHQRGVRHARLRQDARSGVGNSSRVPESTNTPEGPQNGTQGRTGVLPGNREGA